MRFLLRQTSSVGVANRSKAARQLASSDAAAAAVVGTGKAWGQQCSPNCGCVLRIETRLSEHPSSASPTIVQASYSAKRVMATADKTCSSGNGNDIRLKPLTTQGKASSSPILTSCTCPTLHHLAQRTVDHLPGRTLEQLRNEVEMGTVGARTSVAFRHTVLKESVLPSIGSTKKQLGIAKLASLQDERSNLEYDDGSTGVHAMESTTGHGNCYDLVEDSLLSMIHERMPAPRNDNAAESYSPTLGGYFRMYSQSGRSQPADDDDDMQHDERGRENELSSIHEASDWQRRSPSSFFLFGDEASGHNMTGTFTQHLQDSITNLLLGSGSKSSESREDVAKEEHRPGTTYLELLDMYGDIASKDKANKVAYDDWLEYVDQVHSEDDRSFTA